MHGSLLVEGRWSLAALRTNNQKDRSRGGACLCSPIIHAFSRSLTLSPFLHSTTSREPLRIADQHDNMSLVGKRCGRPPLQIPLSVLFRICFTVGNNPFSQHRGVGAKTTRRRSFGLRARRVPAGIHHHNKDATSHPRPSRNSLEELRVAADDNEDPSEAALTASSAPWTCRPRAAICFAAWLRLTTRQVDPAHRNLGRRKPILATAQSDRRAWRTCRS